MNGTKIICDHSAKSKMSCEGKSSRMREEGAWKKAGHGGWHALLFCGVWDAGAV